MKVLHVLPSISPALGGPTQVALNLVHTLCSIGVDAEIATTNHQLSADYPVNQRIHYPIDTDSDQQATVPVWFLPYDPPELKEFIFSKALTGWLWRHLATYDIVDNHYLFSYAPTCAAAIARCKKVPYTVRTMGQLTPWALTQNRFKKQVYSFLIERHNLNCAAAIHCTATDEAKDLQRLGIKTPTITLPLGVKPPQFLPDAKNKLRDRYNIPEQTPIILFLSRLHYKKRPEVLIQAAQQLAAEGQDFHVILAGTGESSYVQTLVQQVNDLKLSEQVTFAGFVAGMDKDLLLQGADIFALPTFSENFGIVLAEAMIAGLPIVTTPGVQISPDILKFKAGLIVEEEPAAFRFALDRLLSSPALRQELGNNGQSLAHQQYAWPKIAVHLASAYRKILEHQSLPQQFPEGGNGVQ
jgi:glycosyltransferase involved in cell wall biosynthesis